MGVTITISDSSGGATVRVQGAAGSAVHLEGSAQPFVLSGSDVEAGAATAASTPMGELAMTGSPLEPPAEVLRAAAATGAIRAGPAPMLTAEIPRAAGEPMPFTAEGREPVTMAAVGAPDQAAGAAPGAEQSAPAVVVEER